MAHGHRDSADSANGGWMDVFVRTLQFGFVAFVILNLKEWLETNEWDLAACAVDSAWIAGGAFVFYAILAVISKGDRRPARGRSASAAVLVACLALAVHALVAQTNVEDFNQGSFGRSTHITNEWLPLTPGTRFVYDGTSVEDDGERLPHRIIVNVTDLAKVIGGVRSVATWDLDYSDGELVEAELAFFAQDNDGNVWRMGEYPEEYEDGAFVAASPWIHGFEAARAGIEMKAKPVPGTPSYSQGWGPAVNWTDRGQVDQIGQKTTVPAGAFDNVLVIAETSQSEPDAQQLKYFARGVGNVRVGWRGEGEKTQEVLELTKKETLDANGLAEVRAAALKLEDSGYKRSKNVYAHTPRLERMSGEQLEGGDRGGL